jgi:hypothetical protein
MCEKLVVHAWVGFDVFTDYVAESFADSVRESLSVAVKSPQNPSQFSRGSALI